MIHLHIARIDYTESATVSVFAVEGAQWGYGLEDRRRSPGIKVSGKTCIPAGSYRVRVSFSQRFKRWMPEVGNVPGFSGIRLHGGNTAADTEGCLIIAAHRPERERVQGSLEAKLVSFLASTIPPLSRETPEAFWARLPETRITIQDGPRDPG
jgi:Steigviridae/Suoliviridae L,D-carboxypeptidase/transpeptidase